MFKRSINYSGQSWSTDGRDNERGASCHPEYFYLETLYKASNKAHSIFGMIPNTNKIGSGEQKMRILTVDNLFQFRQVVRNSV